MRVGSVTRRLLVVAALVTPAVAIAAPVAIALIYLEAAAAIAAMWIAAYPMVAMFVATALYGSYRRRQAAADARRAFNRSQRDRVSMVRSGTEPRQILVGRDRLSGPMVYVASSGSNKQFLHIVIALGGHVFDGLETVYFGDEALPDPDGAGFVQSGSFYKGGTPVDRTYSTPSATTVVNLPQTPSSIVSVTRSDQPPYADDRDSTPVPPANYTLVGSTLTITSGGAAYITVNYRTTTGGKALVRIKKYNGTQTTADADLVAESGGEWTTACVGYGVPYLYVRLEYDSDVFRSVGIPNISVVGRGAILYDPRANRNPAADLVGAVAGSPGTLPANVAVSNFNAGHGIATSVTGTGTDPVSGLPFVDFRVSGTATANGNFVLMLPIGTAAPSAAPGQSWTARVTVRVVAGSWNLASGSQLQVCSVTSGGSLTVEGSTTMPALPSGVTLQVLKTQALASGSTAAVLSRLRFSYSTGVAYSVTVRIMLPELFPGAVASAADCRRWGENAALAAAWWLREPLIGAQAAWEEVPTAELAAEANVSDESVPLAVGSQARYTANGTLYTDQPRRDILEALLSAMAGSACWIQGRWLLRAGAYEVPEMTINEASLAQGDIRIAPRIQRRDLFNAVTGKYTDASSGYIERQQPPVTNPVYVAEDGGKRWSKDDMEHPMVREAVRAQRLAKIELEGMRQAMSITLVCNLSAYDAIPGRTVWLNLARYNIVNKAMLVTNREYMSSERRIRLTMIEISANTYAWNFGNATVVDPAPNSSWPTAVGRPFAPVGLVATDYRLRAGGLGGIASLIPYATLTWTAASDVAVTGNGKVLVQLKRDDASEWIDGGVLLGSATTTIVGPLDSRAASLVRIAFMDDRGRVSDWTVAPVTAQGVAGSGLNTAMPGIAPTSKVWSGATSVTLTIKPNGTIVATGAATVNYFNPTGGTPGASLWVRATKTGGNAVASGNYNGWQQVNADRAWSLAVPSGTAKTCVIRYDFANSSGGAVAASVTASFNGDAVNDTGGGGDYFEP